MDNRQLELSKTFFTIGQADQNNFILQKKKKKDQTISTPNIVGSTAKSVFNT
jgi:hypothetical protein